MPREQASAYFERESGLLRARLILNDLGTFGIDTNMPAWAQRKLLSAIDYLTSQQQTGRF